MKVFKPFLKPGLFLIMLVLWQLHGNAQTPEGQLDILNIKLAKPSSVNSHYIPYVLAGNLLFLSGKGPLQDNGEYQTGKVTNESDIGKAKEAAKLTAINHLRELKFFLGDLSRIKKIVKVNGYINASSDFTGHSIVMDGFSDLLIKVFGAKGMHARTSLGVASLPQQMLLEVEMVVEIYPITASSN